VPNNFKAAGVKLFNDWAAANFGELGAASVIPAGSACFAPEDGTGIAKWLLTPFTAAGGGVLDPADYPAGMASATNLNTTGVTVTSATAPEIGSQLALFDPDMANIEGPGNYQSGSNRAGYIISAVSAGAGKWLVKCSNPTATTRLRPAGSIVRTVSSPDGTHPTHWLQQNAMANSVIAWKAAA